MTSHTSSPYCVYICADLVHLAGRCCVLIFQRKKQVLGGRHDPAGNMSILKASPGRSQFLKSQLEVL